jgi:hypothetical protein
MRATQGEKKTLAAGRQRRDAKIQVNQRAVCVWTTNLTIVNFKYPI